MAGNPDWQADVVEVSTGLFPQLPSDATWFEIYMDSNQTVNGTNTETIGTPTAAQKIFIIAIHMLNHQTNVSTSVNVKSKVGFRKTSDDSDVQPIVTAERADNGTNPRFTEYPIEIGGTSDKTGDEYSDKKAWPLVIDIGADTLEIYHTATFVDPSGTRFSRVKILVRGWIR